MQLDEDIELCLGSRKVDPRARIPFNDNACNFLADLSAALLKQRDAKSEPDITAFAFWCRKAHLQNLKNRFSDNQNRLGRGLAFHIAPSNVPINAFYSFAFGLLSGNANIVRLSSTSRPSLEVVLNSANSLFNSGRHDEIASSTAFFRYEHDHTVTDQLSLACSARLIWGGNATISEIRKSPLQARAHEIAFADRYSFAIIDADTISGLTDSAVEKLATAFFNDTLQMDQNACSSPHLVVWQNGHNTEAKRRFWRCFDNQVLARYNLEPVQAVDRFTRLLSGFIEGPEQRLSTTPESPVQRVSLPQLPLTTDNLRGLYGLFYEYDATSLDEVAHIVNSKYQTLSYFGVKKSALRDFVIKNRLQGIDRIVPIGEALNIDVIWDGHDILKELTRIIDVR